MTLIAFATYGKRRAEFITDSTSYTPSADWTGQCTKHLTLNHLDAAVLSQGPLDFANAARAVALQVSGTVAGFDELVAAAPSWLMELRQFHRDNSPTASQSDVGSEPTVVLLGWSDRAQEFVGYVCASEQDFAPTIADGLWAYPMPWTARPTNLELENLPNHPHTATVRHQWVAKQPRPKPGRLDEWRALAVDARRERSLEKYARVLIGGHITHTRLERGSVISKRIHRFDDTGEEFAQMVAGTMHPASLTAPCYCGSGAPFGACHLAEGLARPCPCNSGSPIGECCWSTNGQTSQPQAVSA